MKIPVYILAGGESRRFGRDKSRALLMGKPLICHSLAAVESFAASVTVVAEAAGKFNDLGCRTIADTQPGLGPIGGLQTALTALQAGDAGEWLLLISCDLHGVQEHWIEQLLDHRQPGCGAVAFRDVRWHPTLALYHQFALDTVERNIRDGRLALQDLLDALQACSPPLPDDWNLLININTPEALERISELEMD